MIEALAILVLVALVVLVVRKKRLQSRFDQYNEFCSNLKPGPPPVRGSRYLTKEDQDRARKEALEYEFENRTLH